jgi:DNA topoisomerase-1
VLAAIVRLLEDTCMRDGNERYAEANAPSASRRCATATRAWAAARIELEFRGKGGKFHRVRSRIARVARIVRHCRELPGQKLFEVPRRGRRRAEPWARPT